MPDIAKIVVDISLGREFDYAVPSKLKGSLCLGSRVKVPFRNSMTYGYVVGFAQTSEFDNLKEICELVGTRPILTKPILKLARWMSGYYCCTLEQAIRTVLPCAIRRPGAGHRKLFYVEALSAVLPDSAGKTSRRLELLEHLQKIGPQPMAEFVRQMSTSSELLRAMQKDGLVRIYQHTSNRSPVEHLSKVNILPTEPLKLSAEQAAALELTRQSIDTHKPSVILLHGVTGSGKTEVYLQAIRHALAQDQGAIVLIPEISLTPQTVERFYSRFGENIAVLHSHLSDGERHDEWHRIHTGKARIVVGARSALFAPLERLGLIVVDEEHEPSYKQAEAPRYNARDVAVMRGHMEKCAVLLGSATPALESFYNVQCGKYSLSSMTERADNRALPSMQVVDMRAETERTGRLAIFSGRLVEAIRRRLENGEQTILFLNRRGYATTVMCPQCGHTVNCHQCSISMTYHKTDGDIRCHICGSSSPAPEKCPECGLPALKFSGIGTQRIEKAVRAIFPHARVQRMDADTARAKHSYENILGDFKSRETDILIGTQMIAKGLHFPGVTLVGVINADSSLHLPDFRAAERTFQLLLQVAGRAGRGEIPGEVIVQTFSPSHPSILAAQAQNYTEFSDQELEGRRELAYPPFTRLICLHFEGTGKNLVHARALAIEQSLSPLLHPSIIMTGPMPAPLSKIKGKYREQILLRSTSVKAMTEPLQKVLAEIPRNSDVRLSIDVDALSLL